MDTVCAAIFNIDNLSPESILNFKGKEMDPDLSKANEDREPYIIFMRFRSSVDCMAIDKRIDMERLLLMHFSLRLPQNIYDKGDDSITLVILPVSTVTIGSTSVLSSTIRTLFGTPLVQQLQKLYPSLQPR